MYAGDAHTIGMGYYAYHATVKNLIKEGHMTAYRFVQKWNSISPALVFFFDNHLPMPVRSYRWREYVEWIEIPNEFNS